MTDIYSKSKRSEIMSHISGRDSKMEISVRKALFSAGLRYRKNVNSLPGKPDIVLPKYKTVIFTHGCFWHGHEGCQKSKLPDIRKKFWKEKILGNIKRDKLNHNILKNAGWKIITVWQCEINNNTKRENRLESIIKEIKVMD